jgi:predicted lipid-binding transport protein (Tim44 family)
VVIHVLDDVRLGIGYAFLAYIVVWILAFVVMAAFAAILGISRRSPDAVRSVFRQVVASHSSRELVHVSGQAGSPNVGAALRNLRTSDPDFDMTAFLDSARVAVGAYAMAQIGKDDRLLRRITTRGFWQTSNGKIINQLMINREQQAKKHPEWPKSTSVILDVSWRQPVVQEVVLDQRGVDRITVRLASVFIGAAMPGWQRVDYATELDWDFVRRAGSKTDPGAVLQPRTCARCGAPYRSEMDSACAFCHAPRADAQAGWRLDRNYLVVQTAPVP